jgi:hypothetical protein
MLAMPLLEVGDGVGSLWLEVVDTSKAICAFENSEFETSFELLYMIKLVGERVSSMLI